MLKVGFMDAALKNETPIETKEETSKWEFSVGQKKI